MTVFDLLAAAHLTSRGPVSWGGAIDEEQPGIYVVATDIQFKDCPLCEEAVTTLSEAFRQREKSKWIEGQEILYIGKTKRAIRTRINEFYRHNYGAKSPHCGGQAVHLLSCRLVVYWAPSDQPEQDEAKLLSLFLDVSGCLPYANRKGPGRNWFARTKSLPK